tara:strand:- start:22956 stop:23177 length:222 start_codon:yes stop_codon:yes gene_type:complete
MNYDRRLDRLASILPARAKQLGCRREDHELRARVEDIPDDVNDRDAVIERRKRMVRNSEDLTAIEIIAREEAQ